jgi:hypothetical protein
MPRRTSSLSTDYTFDIQLVEIISGNDLALVLGLPIGILLVAGLVLFMTTYYFNDKFVRSEQRDLAGTMPSLIPSRKKGGRSRRPAYGALDLAKS